MSVVLPEPAMPITMHAVGWRVVASAALDEAAAGDETVAAATAAVTASIVLVNRGKDINQNPEPPLNSGASARSKGLRHYRSGALRRYDKR